MDVHIFWSGPYSLNNLSKLNDEQKHYGVYQIYGHHALYGSHVLLYIGKADQQTFGKRISQEDWEFIEDPSNTQIYINFLLCFNTAHFYPGSEYYYKILPYLYLNQSLR